MNQALVDRLRFDADRDGVTTDVHHNLLDAADELDRLSLALFQIKHLIGASRNDGKSDAIKESNVNQAWHIADDSLRAHAVTEKRGGYYLNSVETTRARLLSEIRIGERRSETLRRIGSSCAGDHDAAMAVKRKMLAVVEDAIAQTRDQS